MKIESDQHYQTEQGGSTKTCTDARSTTAEDNLPSLSGDSCEASGKKTSNQDNRSPISVLTRTNRTRFQSKLRKQRNRLAHTEDVSINDSLACLQDIHAFFHPGILQTCNDASHPTAGAVKCIGESVCVLKYLSTLPNKKAKINIAFDRLTSRDEHVVHRLMLSSPKDLVGRDDILSKLLSLTTITTCESQQSQPRVLLHGPPGVGKTAVVRKLASDLLCTYPKQYTFRAGTEVALHDDISSFLTCLNIKTEQKSSSRPTFSLFKQYLLDQENSLLLIFEDVLEPTLVMALLPFDKHSVIMTSFTDCAWRKLNFVPSRLFPFQIDPLGVQDSLLLFKQVLVSNGRRNLFDDVWQNAVTKENLRFFLAEGLLGFPLAIRPFAFQLCEENTTAFDFLLLINQSVSSDRTRSDERGAGRVHVRGFFHVVQCALNSISSEDSALQLCFLLSLLPSCQSPHWFVKSVGKYLQICPSMVDSTLELLSKFGLITNHEKTCDMHRLTQCHVRAQIAKHRASVQDSVVAATIQAFRQETFAAFEILLGEEVSCHLEVDQLKQVAEFNHRPNCVVNQAFINLQLEIMITAFLENVELMRLDREQRDTCLRCLRQCCLRRQPFKPCPVQTMRHRAFVNSCYFASGSVDESHFEDKDAFLNVLCLRWGRLCVLEPGTFNTISADIRRNVLKEKSTELSSLLGCAAEALLTSNERDVDTTHDDIQTEFEVEHAAVIVCELFASFGITSAELIERLRRTNEQSTFRCSLRLVDALGVSGQLRTGEKLLFSIVEIWTKRWRTFTVGDKERLVVHMMTFAWSCADGNELDSCVLWCDAAYRVNNINTACSRTCPLSLEACYKAAHILGKQVFWQKKRPRLSYGVIRTWLSRLTPFLRFPNLTVECCANLNQSLVGLTVMSAVGDKVSSPRTMGLLQLGIRGLTKYTTSPIYRGKVFLHDTLVILFLLVSRARTPSELNMRYVRTCCRVLAHIIQRDKTRETWLTADYTLNYLLKFASTWNQLTIEEKCYVYCGNVYAAHCLFRFSSHQIISNQFFRDTCRETVSGESASGTLKPNPGVIRAAIDVFADELRQCGKINASDSLLEIFKMWPSPDEKKQLHGNLPQT